MHSSGPLPQVLYISLPNTDDELVSAAHHSPLSLLTQSLVSPLSLLNGSGLATSVDVERTFSPGRLILSHVRSHLSAQSTRALLCLGSWSLLGMVNVEGVEEEELEEGWDTIR
jgi:hypothetical protein